MVKNTVGGKKGKMMANKIGNGGGGGSGSGSGGGGNIRLIEVPDIEMFVCVTKVFGGGLFEVIDNNANTYRAFLRGKMKGHNKRHNLVSLFSILLVAKRIDTDPSKCDILFVYDSHDIQFLTLNPTLNITHLLSIHNNHFTDFDNNYNNNNNYDNHNILFNNNIITDTDTYHNILNNNNNFDNNNNNNNNFDNNNNNNDIDFDINII